MDRFNLIRESPPPYGSLLYVYYTGTSNEVPIFEDIGLTIPIPQPVIITDENWHFYSDNTRLDIKIYHHSYTNGFFMIQDVLMFNHDREDHWIDGGEL